MKSFLPAVFLLLMASLCAAEQPAALFLMEAEPDAHLYSMGNVFTSLDFKDTFNSPWLPTDGASGVTLSHWPGALVGSGYNSIGLALAPRDSVLTFTLLHYSAGTETIDEFDGTERSVRLEEDLLAGIGYGRQVVPDIYAGAAVKYLQSTLAEDYHANVLMGDCGVFYRLPGGVHHAGIALRNIGGTLTYYKMAEPLPTELSAGYTARFPIESADVILGAACAHALSDGRDSLSFGAACYPGTQFLVLSAGVRAVAGDTYFTAGLGFQYSGLNIDLGYGFNHTLAAESSPLRFSLAWRWGNDTVPAKTGRALELW